MLSSVLGIGSLLFLYDGLWGLGQRTAVPVLLGLIGLCGVVVVAYWGKMLIPSAVGLVAFASIVGCLIAECVFRIFIAEPTIPVDERSFEKRIVAAWPHPVEPQKRDGVFRILGLSDSFGLAGGERNYHYLLADVLAGHGASVEIANLSVSGSHPADELELVREFGTRFQPNLILNGVFVGNDFFFPPARTVEIAGIPLLCFPLPNGIRPKFFLLFRWIRGEIKLLREAFLSRLERWRGLPSGGTSEKEFLWIESRYLLACRKGAPDGLDWARTIECIHQIQEEAGKMGAKYVMLIHPDQCQIDTALLSRVIGAYDLDPYDFDLQLPQRYLGEDCERRGVPCLDLAPAFREKGAAGGLYAFRDTHWNEAGNRLAAEKIAEFLLARNLVPSQTRLP